MNPFLSLSGRRRLPLIRQAETAECGLASIAMVAGFYGHEADMATLRRRFGLSMKGMTLRTMIDIAAALGFSGRPVRCEIHELGALRRPAILHWGANHFVVLARVTRSGVVIHDPEQGRMVVPTTVVSRMFTGVALELTPNAAFQRTRERAPLKLSTLFTLDGGVGTALLQTGILSLVVEALMLAGPFYLQFVIDDAIVKGDVSLLQVFALAFGLLTIFRVAATLLRGLTTQFVSNVLAFDMKGRIFNHMVRLPLDWFQKRQIGDVPSRFWAVRAIQAFVSQGALTGLMDGVLGSIVLALMFLYSRTLVAITLSSSLTDALIKIARSSSASASRRIQSWQTRGSRQGF